MRITSLLLAGATALAAAACGGHTSYVESDTALGRIVVYRNGIAYYERRAQVTDNKLDLTVPNDKVDDFLKSLTVTDAKTGEALPVSYPTRGATQGNDVAMTIQLPPGPSREVKLTYITEAPSWKPSYRLVMHPGSKIEIQGWAIVDNTSGEDWKDVRVGVGSSSAMSFRYDLRSVRNVYRETLKQKARFAAAPPRGGSTYRDQGGATIELADADIPKPAGHPGSVYNAPAPPPMAQPSPAKEPRGDMAADEMEVASARPARIGGLGSGGGGRGVGLSAKGSSRSRYGGKRKKDRRKRYKKPATRKTAQAKARPKPRDVRREKERRKVAEQQRKAQQQARQQRKAEAKVRKLAAQLNKQPGTIRIDGFATRGERNARAKSLERANTLRNQLIRFGVAPGRLRAVGRGHVSGRGSGVRLVNEGTGVADAGDDKAAQKAAVEGDGEPVGESHFESEARLTVERGTSAMVAIVHTKAKGEEVYLYTAASERGNKRYAFKAVRFRNPTDSTLETGPVTVYGEGRFVGEGLTEPIPPGATAIIPFALDRQIVVDRESGTEDRIHKLMTLQRGVATAEVLHERRTTLKLTNRLTTSTRLFVRHEVPKGFKLTANPKVFERQDRAYLFSVELKAGETKKVDIREATPMNRTIDLRSPMGVDMIRVYLNAPDEGGRFAVKMKALLKIHAEMENHKQSIESLRERMGEYRARMDELHTQIVSLTVVKAGGTLLRHLQKKMKEISDRVDKSTVKVVEHQEKLMLARIRFQDGVAELTLDPKDIPKPKPAAREAKAR